ncbi:MAG: RsmB/NOP family class I SAM-dependent RNA methyltransferase [Rhodobacteraceae bacterium]|nr:MAG: RsmB/NOP family class I SAM-dependent RNA methyltransferase [Paracoccaceae bacterium]
MTPAARHQAAIEILERIRADLPAEQALTGWARNARFAGSKDRAAIRDLVYDALRCRRSFAHLGGADTGRGLILGGVRAAQIDPDTIFTGAGHAPAPLSDSERRTETGPMPEAVALDSPDWLLPIVQDSLNERTVPILEAMRHRAAVFVRVNLARTSRDKAIRMLQADAIIARPHPLAPTALEVIENARAIHRSAAYVQGLVELQDAASQAVIAALPDPSGMRTLDFCAGGGGKALALAARGAQVTAHDIAPARMKDLPERARRAQVTIPQTQSPTGLFDLVLADVPCSGAGSWRRSPAGKWALTPERLHDLQNIQRMILDQCCALTVPGGYLAYVTCSLLKCENHQQISAFRERAPEFDLHSEHQFTPLDGGDGLYVAVLQRSIVTPS